MSWIRSDCKQIGSTYIHIQFVNQRHNGFGSNLDIQIKNANPYPTKRIGFEYKFDPLIGLKSSHLTLASSAFTTSKALTPLLLHHFVSLSLSLSKKPLFSSRNWFSPIICQICISLLDIIYIYIYSNLCNSLILSKFILCKIKMCKIFVGVCKIQSLFLFLFFFVKWNV